MWHVVTYVPKPREMESTGVGVSLRGKFCKVRMSREPSLGRAGGWRLQLLLIFFLFHFFFFCTCQWCSLVFVHFSCLWRAWRMQGALALWHFLRKKSLFLGTDEEEIAGGLASIGKLPCPQHLVACVDSEVLERSSSTFCCCCRRCCQNEAWRLD